MKYKSISVFFSLMVLWICARAYEDSRNHSCLKCHSRQTFSFDNSVTQKIEKRIMNPYFILDTIALNSGAHKQFDCTDCHSSEYATYPHPSNLKLEPLGNCIDCHGGDEAYATYKFEQIEEETRKSIHYQVYGDNFTCSKCHSQHTYTATARTSENVLEIVDYSNKMCLSCHNDMKKYQLVSGHENPKLVDIHEWLPNQKLHFEHVRCIECHTEVVDSLMVSHNILAKSHAVKNCVECHSANSKLKASLYKYEKLQNRSENSGISSFWSNSSYTIGTHQLPRLKSISIFLFLATCAGIFIHGIIRFIKK